MALKEDYKDAMFDGQRRYRLIQNEDGTYSLPDETNYTQEGDKFGANDLNAITRRINCMNEPISITLTAAGWAGSAAPYTQTVAVEGMTADCNPDLVSLLADGASEATQKAYNKAFGMVAAGTGTTGAGTVTFKVYKKPEIDIVVGLKGVW